MDQYPSLMQYVLPNSILDGGIRPPSSTTLTSPSLAASTPTSSTRPGEFQVITAGSSPSNDYLRMMGKIYPTRDLPAAHMLVDFPASKSRMAKKDFMSHHLNIYWPCSNLSRIKPYKSFSHSHCRSLPSARHRLPLLLLRVLLHCLRQLQGRVWLRLLPHSADLRPGDWQVRSRVQRQRSQRVCLQACLSRYWLYLQGLITLLLTDGFQSVVGIGLKTKQ